ncbi:hypothetical protein PR048_018098 [Dryococelus australis]|uniref:Uncharacterized protein n=1 Tax=Dryococelus australis TaxID=614101 RepID=A0ABQ9HBA8_9NEOP|nr:hypothetical protein PR048_018098 [Dryococelus australis]
MTYYSPCHIGCQSKVLDKNRTKTFFTNCTCIPNLNTSATVGEANPTFLDDPSVIIENGPCPVDCTTMLYAYVMIGFFIHVLSSSGRVGSVLINLRCVEKKDKVFAQGLTLLCISLFAFIPGPIIFGAIISNSSIRTYNIYTYTAVEAGSSFPEAERAPLGSSLKIILLCVTDRTCLVWDSTCGTKGNCWLYHKDQFRIYMNCTAA